MDRDKKISFGFNKLNKKTSLLQNKPVEHDKVELIECVEERSIKIKDAPKVINTPLVIPIKNNKKGLLDRIAKANQKDSPQKKLEQEDDRLDSELTIEELAARELINDAKNRLSNNTPNKRLLVLPFKEDESTFDGERESTLDDYENIPVSDYGLAMLRGMGWKEGMGIGKNSSKLEPAKVPELRPKGLGLGATKILKSEIPNDPVCDKDGSALILKKGTYAKIIAGSHKGDYCEVQGFDEDAARVIVKTSLRGEILTINEFLVLPITKEEYLKNSKVLNNEKYEEYKKISDKNLENYHRKSIKPTKIEEKIKKESTPSSSSKEETETYSKSFRTNINNSDYENNDKTHRSKNKHAKNSDDTDSERNKSDDRSKRNSDSKRNRYHKEERRHRSRSPSDYHEKEKSKKNKSKTRHSRSNSNSNKSDGNRRKN